MLSGSSCTSGIPSNPPDWFLEDCEQCPAQPMFETQAVLSPLLEGWAGHPRGKGTTGLLRAQDHTWEEPPKEMPPGGQSQQQQELLVSTDEPSLLTAGPNTLEGEGLLLQSLGLSF